VRRASSSRRGRKDGQQAEGRKGIATTIIEERVRQLVDSDFDSHTCMDRRLGCLALAWEHRSGNAWVHRDVRMKSPRDGPLRSLRGRIGEGVCAKDVMLPLWAAFLEKKRSRHGKGSVIDGLRGLRLP